MMRVAKRSRKARSWVTTIAVCRPSRPSSVSMPEMSRWLVGSSRSSRSGSSASASASVARLPSPPESAVGSSSPETPKRSSIAFNRASVAQRSRSSWIEGMCPRSSRLACSVGAFGSTGSCSTRATRRPSRRTSSPSSSCSVPAMAESSEDLPVPLRPISPMRSPDSSEKAARSSSGRSPKASCPLVSVSSGMGGALYSVNCGRGACVGTQMVVRNAPCRHYPESGIMP